MKNLFISLVVFFFVEAGAFAAEPTLVVYGYDSLVAKRSWGEKVARSFEKKMRDANTPVRVKLVSVGEGSQILNRLRLDQKRGKALAHIAWGIDTDTFEKIKEDAASFTWPGKFPLRAEIDLKKLPAGFIPFDFGVYAFIQNTALLPLEQAPRDWVDLILPRFKKKLLLQDPRTSIPGLAWLLGSEQSLGRNEALLYWKNLQNNWLTLAPSWTQSYALFSKDQAPLVWSYLTSQAYHAEHGDKKGQYRAVLFSSGQPIQIEGLSILKTAPDYESLKTVAQNFVEHVLSLESQTSLPQAQWMMPVRSDVVLPESFKGLPQAMKLHSVFEGLKETGRADILKRWREALQTK